jgi:bacterioferritin (cytochrome b1)
MLGQKYACAIRYATHADVISGPFSASLSQQFREISGDELRHAHKLRQRIVALGGTPSLAMKSQTATPACTLRDMLTDNILEEREAIEQYSRILNGIPRGNAILYHAIEDILRDEQEHLEQLLALKPKD